MRGDARVSLAGRLLSFDQRGFLLSNLACLVLISLRSCFLSSAFGLCLLFGGFLLFLDSLLLLLLLLKDPNVLGQVLVHCGHGPLFLREKVSLARKEAEQAVEVVVDALGLLHTGHEETIEFVCHLSYPLFSNKFISKKILERV